MWVGIYFKSQGTNLSVNSKVEGKIMNGGSGQGAGKMAEQVKSLLCKYGDLSLDSL